MKTKRKPQRPQQDDTGGYQYIWPVDWPNMNTAWFYIPLPIPLKLPDRFVLPIVGSPYDQDSQDFPEIDPTQLIGFIGSLDEPFPDDPIGVYVSLCVHQIEGSTNIPATDAAFTAAQRRPWLDKPELDPIQAPIVTTVLECCISLGDISRDDLEDALDTAFDKVLQEVNAFLRDYMVLTHERIALVQKETLPFAIPCGWSLDRDHESELGPDELVIYLINFPDPLIISMSAKPNEHMSMDEISEMLSYCHSLADPLMTEIHKMFVDAQLARHRGEYAVAVVLLASGWELLLRLLLEVLLWESGTSPRDAVSEIYAPNGVGHAISYLLKSKFHDRLGGAWDISSTSNAVGWMYQSVFETRNRYLHTATAISRSETDAALEASANFFEFIHTRLKDHIRTYPLAAHMFIGEPIITDMGLRDQIDRALRDKETQLALSPLMHNSTEHLRAYRRETRNHQDPSIWTGTSMIGEVNEQTHVAALIYPDDSIEYWLIDPDRAVACCAETPTMSTEQHKLIKELVRTANHQPSNWLNTCRLLDTPAKPLETTPNWVSAYEVWRMEHKQG
ncbi:MAG: hypothetical protein OXB92_05475 [Acidimicrobiaceae bacterium]|nr:hypothetical protein [Acidimicrobiia bacterium]MCY4493289.1 hypothetical protein [Acidimicrobiaceae bacterium]